MSRRWDSGTREAGIFERGSQTSWVNPIFVTRRHGGGDLDSRPALTIWTDGSLSGELSHRSAILSVPHTLGVTSARKREQSGDGARRCLKRAAASLGTCPRPDRGPGQLPPPHSPDSGAGWSSELWLAARASFPGVTEGAWCSKQTAPGARLWALKTFCFVLRKTPASVPFRAVH